MSQWIQADYIMLRNVVCFHLNGYINWNNVYWVQDNPHVTVDVQHQTNPRITKRSMRHSNTLLGPVFMEGGINTKLYLQLFNDMLEWYIDEMPLTACSQFYFQQDWGPSLLARRKTSWMKFFTGERLDAGNELNSHLDSQNSHTKIFPSGVIWIQLCTIPAYIPLQSLKKYLCWYYRHHTSNCRTCVQWSLQHHMNLFEQQDRHKTEHLLHECSSLWDYLKETRTVPTFVIWKTRGSPYSDAYS